MKEVIKISNLYTEKEKIYDLIITNTIQKISETVPEKNITLSNFNTKDKRDLYLLKVIKLMQTISLIDNIYYKGSIWEFLKIKKYIKNIKRSKSNNIYCISPFFILTDDLYQQFKDVLLDFSFGDIYDEFYA